MTAVTAAARRDGRARAGLAGADVLARAIVRRDRVRLLMWVLGMVALPVGLAAASASAYPTDAIREAFAAAANTDPAELALRGPLFAPTVGGIVAWTLGSSGVLVTGVVNVLLVVRHTRVDEGSGVRDLLAAGRVAPLAAVLAVVLGGNAAIAVLTAAGLAAQGLPVSGSVALGLVLGVGGAVFAGVGALTAQLGRAAGGARGVAFAATAVFLALAAAGDLTGSPVGWASPFGWTRHVRSFAHEQWWLFGPLVVLAGLLITVALSVADRRDVGAGLIGPRPGPATGRLASPFAVAWRRDRGAVVATVVTLAVLGAVLGSAAPSLAAQLGGSGSGATFFLVVLYVLAQAATALAVATVLRLRGDETGGLAEVLLTAGVSRTRWASAQIAVAVLGTAAALAALGTGAGVASGLGLGDPFGRTVTQLGTTLAFLPACLVLTGVTVAVVGWAPRAAATVAWIVLGALLVLDLLGEFRLVPAGLLQLSPYQLTMEELRTATGSPAAVLAALLVLAVVLTAVGLAGLRRRDVG